MSKRMTDLEYGGSVALGYLTAGYELLLHINPSQASADKQLRSMTEFLALASSETERHEAIKAMRTTGRIR